MILRVTAFRQKTQPLWFKDRGDKSRVEPAVSKGEGNLRKEGAAEREPRFFVKSLPKLRPPSYVYGEQIPSSLAKAKNTEFSGLGM